MYPSGLWSLLTEERKESIEGSYMEVVDEETLKTSEDEKELRRFRV
jgi:hypothetical protein